MRIHPDDIEALPVADFRRFGIACCYRLGCDRMDKRLAKALRRLERSLGPPPNEKLRRDAYNAANSVYRDLSTRSRPAVNAAVCAVLCACWAGPNRNLLGNFERALEENEQLSRDQIREIEIELLRAVMCGQKGVASPEDHP